MSNLDIVYDGEFFLKVKPTDNTKEINNVKNDLEHYKKVFEEEKKRLEKKEFISTSDLQKLRKYAERVLAAKASTEASPINLHGMDHFWSLSLGENDYILTTIPNHDNDEIIMNTYHNLDAIAKEYRSIPDIISNGEFRGRLKHFNGNPFTFYMLYRYAEGFISYLLDEEKNVRGFSVAVDPLGNVNPDGDRIPELDDPALVYKFINRLKYRG